jgi:hypothetical protein
MFFQKSILKISLLIFSVAIFAAKAAPLHPGLKIIGESIFTAGVHHLITKGVLKYKNRQLKKKIENHDQENPDSPHLPHLHNRTYHQ